MGQPFFVTHSEDEAARRDGRANIVDAINKGNIDISSNLKYKRGPKNCVECGKEVLRINRGRCGACYARLYRKEIITPEHKEEMRQKRIAYRKENRDRINAYWRKRRAITRKYRITFEKKHGKRKTYPRSEEYRAKVAATYKKVCDYKLKKGCVDCGYNKHPEALDFDHLPQYEKKYGISSLARSNAAPETLWAEIAKCEVRCTNCHRIKTYERRVAADKEKAKLENIPV